MSDVVEHWKRLGRASMSPRTSTSPGTRRITVRVTLAFMLVCVATGLPGGLEGALIAFVSLASALLAQELPRALFARALGRSSDVVVSLSAGETMISGVPLRGAAALGVATMGSLANVLI